MPLSHLLVKVKDNFNMLLVMVKRIYIAGADSADVVPCSQLFFMCNESTRRNKNTREIQTRLLDCC